MKKLPKIADAMGYIDEELICEAESYKPKRKGNYWVKWVASAACLCMVIMAGLLMFPQSPPVPGPSPSPSPDTNPLLGKNTATVIYGNEGIPEVTSESELVYLTEEELFEKDAIYAFRGTVISLENVTIDFSEGQHYRCIARIQIQNVYRGDFVAGEEISMLLPCAILDGGVWQEDSETISNIKVGMEGIFTPFVYDENSYMEMCGKYVYWSTLAPCGLGDGMRWVFLETDTGLSYARWAYEGAAGSTTLDDIEEYVIEMLK